MIISGIFHDLPKLSTSIMYLKSRIGLDILIKSCLELAASKKITWQFQILGSTLRNGCSLILNSHPPCGLLVTCDLALPLPSLGL